jgi:hypothetical protein
MFWVALSVLIMSLTGEGDDTFAFRSFLERGRAGVEENVTDAARRKAALKALDEGTRAFTKHRQRTSKVSDCIERADRSYFAGAAEYERCLVDLGPSWDAAGEDLLALERSFQAALTPAELAAVRRTAGY